MENPEKKGEIGGHSTAIRDAIIDQIIENYSTFIQSWIARYFPGDSQKKEDIMQDILAKFCNMPIPELRSIVEEKQAPYIYKITSNHITDIYRKEKTRIRIAADRDISAMQEFIPATRSSHRRTPDEIDRIQKELTIAIDELTGIIFGMTLRGFTRKEIAKLRKISRGTIDTKIHRIKQDEQKLAIIRKILGK